MQGEHFDVLVIGAGLSGVGAGYWLQKLCPNKSYAILEARASMGGTWDLFRYPGIRSDSDMFTLGYAFKPWTDPKAIADGPSILSYIEETARENGIDRKIRYNQRVVSAAWSSADAQWKVEVERDGGERATYTCAFLFMCSGYYRYESGYLPDFAGYADYRGQIVHPQQWPDNLDYAGKRVIIIGSGATAMTLVPEMAKTAGHVTMVQRSPTYVVARPTNDAVADFLRATLPAKLAYWLVRWKNILFGMYIYNLSRRSPERLKKFLLGQVRKELPGYDVETHFTPRYNPWDQRICLITDGDLFAAIREGRASVETDAIERFTPTGLKLASGKEIEADIIVTATGLALQGLGGATFAVDGKPLELANTLSYKGMMFSDAPNLAATFGYTNASWTLKADLIAERVCRMLKAMDEKGARIVVAHNDDANMKIEPFVDFSSGYFQRSLQDFPKQGADKPWRLYQNYVKDLVSLRYGDMEDGALRFVNPPAKAPAAKETEAV